MSLWFLLFSFISNSIYLLKGHFPKGLRLQILTTYIYITFFYYFSEYFHSKSIKFLQFRVEGFEYKNLYYLFGEIFVRGVYYFESDSKKPLIVDCGSNIGFSILFFKFLYPESTIYAFEPDPDTFRMLQKNIKANQLSHVTAFNSAVSDTEGAVAFYTSTTPGSVSMSSHKIWGWIERYR